MQVVELLENLEGESDLEVVVEDQDGNLWVVSDLTIWRHGHPSLPDERPIILFQLGDRF